MAFFFSSNSAILWGYRNWDPFAYFVLDRFSYIVRSGVPGCGITTLAKSQRLTRSETSEIGLLAV